MYQFGPLLPFGPLGQVDAGLGKTVPLGTSGLVAPTETISETGAELDVDGVRIVFQNTPDAEAPSEMNFFFPDMRLLCMAENCTHTLHNLYPIRGAQVRDALAWSKYIHEAMRMWGDHTDTVFRESPLAALRRRRREPLPRTAARRVPLDARPDAAAGEPRPHARRDRGGTHHDFPIASPKQSHVQGYYGTVSHNVRSVYNRYLGWYDGNPANLHPHPPVDAANRYVEMMGGADAVMRGARVAFDEGDYRWTVEVLKHLIFHDPEHRAARSLSADAMEQLGYQAESSTWRNAYLMGAYELRNGTVQLGRGGPPALANGMTGEQLIDMMGLAFRPCEVFARHAVGRVDRDRPRRADADADAGPLTHRSTVDNATMHHDAGDADALPADAHVRCDRAAMVDVIAYPERLDERIENGTIQIVSGDRSVVEELLGSLDSFVSADLVEP